MVRPRRFRRIWKEPEIVYFKPRGVPLSVLNEIELNVDELEALRLKDFEGKEQIEAAKIMDVSQPTFHRILVSARGKVAQALVNGFAIKIHGGVYKMPNKDGTGPEGKGPRTGRGMGKCPGTGGSGRPARKGQGRRPRREPRRD